MGSNQVHRGSLEKVSPSTLIGDIFRGGFTGVLTLEQGERKKSLFMRHGSVIFGDSSEMEDRLGQVLVRGDRITEDKITAALEIQKKDGDGEKELLGTILVKKSFIKPLDLVWAVRTQVEGIFCDCFSWNEGNYVFAEEGNPDDWEIITLEIEMPELFRNAIGMVEDPMSLGNLLGDFGQLIDVSADWMEMVERFKLQPMEFDLPGRAQAGADTLATLLLSSPYTAAETARGALLLNCLGVFTLSKA